MLVFFVKTYACESLLSNPTTMNRLHVTSESWNVLPIVYHSDYTAGLVKFVPKKFDSGLSV